MPWGKVGKEKVYRGSFSYFLGQEFKDKARRSCALVQPPFPTSSPQPNVVGSISTPRSIELWKEPESEVVHVVVSSTPEDLPVLLRELGSVYPGMRVVKIDEKEPAFVSHSSEYLKLGDGWDGWFFDIEQAHALPGTWFDMKQEQLLLENLVRALKGKGGWLQVCWQSYSWGGYIEGTSMRIQQMVKEIEKGVEVTTPGLDPVGAVGLAFGKGGGGGIKMDKKTVPHPAAGSTLAIHGPGIAKDYFEKGQRDGIIVSIRGFILSKTPPEQLKGAVASVKMDYDFLTPWYYQDPRGFRWLRSRAIPDPTEILKVHAANGGFGEWGRSRELIPVLCVTPEEMPLLVHLPQDPGLLGVVHYARSGGLPEPVEEEEPEVVLGGD